MYKVAFTAQNLGYASAIAILLLAIVAALSVMILAISNPLKDRSDL